MAEFNPTPPINPPMDYSGASRGIRSSPDTAIGTLFEGLAGTLDQGIKEQDRNIKKNIEGDIFDEVDAVQGEFGVPDATDLESDAEEVSARTAPAGVTRAKEQLDTLQAAYSAGKLKESHYWARLNSSVRQLRGKYPGYRAEIDQMVASVTGARPANALRSALIREWEDAQAGARDYDKFVEKVAGETGLPSDFYPRAEAGNPYSQRELMQFYSRKNAVRWDTQERRSAMAEEMDQDALNVRTAERNFAREANQKVTTILEAASTAAGTTYSQMQETIREAQRMAAAGSPMSPEEINQMRGQMGELIQLARLGLHETVQESWTGDPQHSYLTLLDEKQINDQVELALTPLKIMEEALANEEWGVLSSNAAWLETQKTSAQREVLEDIPVMRKISGVREAVGPEVFNQLLTLLDGKSMAALDKALLDYWNADSSSAGSGSSISDAFETGEAKDRGESYYNGLTDMWVATIDSFANGELPVSEVQSKIGFMFGPDSFRVMSQLLDKGDGSRTEYFKKVASPAISKQMIKLKNDGGTEEWEMYQRWVARSFQVLFRQNIDTVQSLVRQPDLYEIAWDPKNFRFKTKFLQSAFKGPNEMGLGIGFRNILQPSVTELNSAIQVLRPIIEENGYDTSVEMLNMFVDMGFDPDAEPQSGIIQKFVRSIQQALQANAARDAGLKMGSQAGAEPAEEGDDGERRGIATGLYKLPQVDLGIIEDE